MHVAAIEIFDAGPLRTVEGGIDVRKSLRRADDVKSDRLGKATVIFGLALILAATLFPYDFSFDDPRSFSNRFGLSSTIGARGNELIIGADPVLGQRFSGKIDELRVYRRALTPRELDEEAKLALAGDDRVPPGSLGAGSEARLEGLAAAYSFNETSGTHVRDHSGKAMMASS